MRVVVDGRWLTATVPSGTRWLHGMLPALRRVRPAWELLVTRPARAVVGPLVDTGCRPLTHPRAVAPGPVSGIWLAWAGARVGADVVVSQYFGPWGSARLPHVTVVHDALWTEHPEWFDRRPRTMLRLVRPSLRGALTVTVSAAAADQLRRAGLSRDPHVVPNGVDLPAAGTLVPPRARRGGLVVARANVRKNLATAVTAWARSTTNEPLSVVGATTDELVDLVGLLPPRVHALGRVDDAALRHHYATARVVLVPSLGEGFSLPPLEAMAHGTPVIASDIDVHRELYAGTAILVPPLDLEAWASAITDLLAAGEEAVARTGSAGRRLAESMTWDDAADRLARVLEDAATP